MPLFVAPFPFYLIRHGQTDWNAEGRFQGSVDIPLNDIGRAQAKRNGAAFKRELPNVDGWHFVSSPLSRARETMEILRHGAGLEPEKYALDPLLREVSYGDWERQTIEEISKTNAAGVEERAKNKWEFVPPNGESYLMLSERVKTVLAALDGPTVITAHGGVLRSIYYLIGDMDPETAAIADVPQDRFLYVDGTQLRWV
ncbi:MAG: histidine phosphatase family protein [Notoacmeibacter sp.]